MLSGLTSSFRLNTWSKSCCRETGRQRLGELEYDDEGFFLLRDEPLSLTPRELSLLKVLMHRVIRTPLPVSFLRSR
jgi:DNA-binding response OmpR family regulator